VKICSNLKRLANSKNELLQREVSHTETRSVPLHPLQLHTFLQHRFAVAHVALASGIAY